MRDITIRNDTFANLNSNNPVLEDGQLCWAHDLRVLKIGDGVSAWSQLSDLLQGDEDAWTRGDFYYIPLPKVGYARCCFKKIKFKNTGKINYYVYIVEHNAIGVINREINARNYAWSWDELPGDKDTKIVTYYNVDIPISDIDALNAEYR